MFIRKNVFNSHAPISAKLVISHDLSFPRFKQACINIINVTSQISFIELKLGLDQDVIEQYRRSYFGNLLSITLQ